MAMLLLKKGKEKSILRGHPWIFSGAVQSMTGEAGDLVPVQSADGKRLGSAMLNPNSQIVGRLVSMGDKPLPADWLTRRIAGAFQRRASLLTPATTACRRIHGEADELPGLICDQYGDLAVLQLNAWGWELRKEEIAAALKANGITAAYMRGDQEARKREGLSQESGPLFGDANWNSVPILENGLHFTVDAAEGHKTGFYLDQRENRALVRTLSQGRTFLNLCAYTGGFTVAAAAGGATSWTSVDISAPTVEKGKSHLTLNGLPEGDWVKADVFAYLREAGPSADCIVLDPPAFAKSKFDVEKAARGYKDLNRLSMGRLRVGGWLLTFSCSHHISLDLFQKIVFSGADEARASMQVVRRLGAGEDHPFHIRHPEGEYLKGLLLRRIE